MSQEEHDDREDQGFLSLARKESLPQKRVCSYARLLLEVAMLATIAILAYLAKPSAECSTLKKSPVPRFPRRIYTFVNNQKYAEQNMFFNETATLKTLHNWIPLSSDSRGYTVVRNAQSYDLPDPIIVALDRHNDGPGYIMSVFHQLHCLSYLAEHYQRGYGGIALEKEVAHHSAHCFNYLRQGIMCSADTTLEGKTEAGPGEGSEHECTDYDASLKWANKHGAYKWRNGLLPDTSVL